MKTQNQNQHHIWCNFWMRPIETCAMCKGLYAKYPMDGQNENELLVRHFPQVAKDNGITPSSSKIDKSEDN